jgi:hypothetical protein
VGEPAVGDYAGRKRNADWEDVVLQEVSGRRVVRIVAARHVDFDVAEAGVDAGFEIAVAACSGVAAPVEGRAADAVRPSSGVRRST